MEQLTKEQAIAFYDSKVYESWSARQIAEFQMEQDLQVIQMKIYTD